VKEQRFDFSDVKAKLPEYLTFWGIANTLNRFLLADIAIWLFVHTLPLSIGILSKKIFDNITLKNDFSSFMQMVLFCLIILFINICFIYIGAQIDIRYKITLKNLLYTKVTDKASSHWKEFWQTKGRVIDSLNADVEMIVDTISYFIDTFANLCLSILAIWILSRIDIKLTIVMCVPIFATVSLGILSKHRLSVLSKMNRNIAQKISSDAYAFVQSFEMIKMSGMEEYVIDQIESQNEIKKKIDLKRNRLLSMIGILNQITGDLTIAFLLLFMAKPLKESTISLGDFTIFIFYSRYVTEFTAVYLSSYVMKKRQTEVSINNLNEILGVCEKEDRVEDRVLRNIVGNLKDEKIDFVELVGQNGSGKTYLAESVFNFMIKNHRIAVLSQTPIIFNTSIKKNIILDRSLDTSRFNCVTSLAALEEDEFSEGFESIAGIRGAMLSGGQIFRIALARLLYNEPYYIIIDGGLNAVEEDKRETILHNLYNRYRGRILYTTTQDVQYGFIENKKIITL